MKKSKNDLNRSEQLAYFMRLANLLKERTRALVWSFVRPKTMRRVFRFEPENEGVVAVFRDFRAEFILKGWGQLPREIKEYLSPDNSEVDVESKQIKFRMETLLVISEYLRVLSDLNKVIHYATPITENLSETEFAEYRSWVVNANLRELNHEYFDFLRTSLHLAGNRFWLENDQTVRFMTSPLVDLLQGVNIKRIRCCETCVELFYAQREDAWACSKNCANTLRQRRWVEKQGRPKRVLKKPRKDPDARFFE